MSSLRTGNGGEEQDRTGADGKDEILEVPLGTVAKRADTDEVLFEITEDGKEYILHPVDVAEKETLILQHLPIRLHNMLNPANPEKKNGSFLS